jgi:hypothetical protein
MSVITIQQCPACRKNEEELPNDQWEAAADPNCLQCEGSGHNEVDKEKRLEEDRKMNDVLDKMDLMDTAGIDCYAMSDEEFERWTPETDCERYKITNLKAERKRQEREAERRMTPEQRYSLAMEKRNQRWAERMQRMGQEKLKSLRKNRALVR